TICSSAARVPVAETVRATIVSAAGTTRTARAGAAAGAPDFLVAAVAGSSCWQPAVRTHAAKAARATRSPPAWTGRPLESSGPRDRRGGGERWATLWGRIGYPFWVRQGPSITECSRARRDAARRREREIRGDAPPSDRRQAGGRSLRGVSAAVR